MIEIVDGFDEGSRQERVIELDKQLTQSANFKIQLFAPSDNGDNTGEVDLQF